MKSNTRGMATKKLRLRHTKELKAETVSRQRKACRGINCEGIKEILSRQRKIYRDIVDRMKRKMLVATRKIMSQQIPGAEGNEKLVATNLVSRHKTLMS